MKRFSVLVIEPNDIKLDYKYNKEIINKYISIKNTSLLENQLVYLIVDTLKMTPNDMGDTVIISESSDYVTQLCCKGEATNEIKNTGERDKKDMNNIASYLIKGDKQIYGPVIVLRSEITDNNTCKESDMTIDLLHNILNSKFIHKGIRLGYNKDITEFTFKNYPLEDMEEELINNYKWLEVPLFKFNLLMYIQIEPINNVINGYATRIVGDKVIYGDVIIVSKSTEYEYIDLDIDIFKKLLKICGGSLDSRNIKDIDKEGECIDGLPIVTNRYRIVNMIFNKYKKICNYCEQPTDTFKICKGCYRFEYHNIECQKKDWNTHKSQCLYGENPINISLKK